MRGLLLSVAVALLFATAAGRASASEVYSPGTVGLDVSWPQCGQPLPSQAGPFAIVGATGGRALTPNPCLADQVGWAQAHGASLSFYMNMKFPSGTTVNEGLTGPAGNCRSDDWACQASNYGYKTAQQAVGLARSAGTTGTMWWLDIETSSTWSDQTSLNVLVIRGAIDYLRANGLSGGIYSTAYQWGQIAGDFAPGLPVWAGGSASSLADPARCRTGFGGGQVLLIQYLAGGFDTDYACQAKDYVAAAPTPAQTPIAAPVALTLPPPAPTPAAPPSPSLSAPIPPRGFGLTIFSGGTAQQLATTAGCGTDTAAFFFSFDGSFVAYIPAAQVAAANADFLSHFPDGNIAPNTPLIGRC